MAIKASRGFASNFTSVDKSLFWCYTSVDICFSLTTQQHVGSNIDFLPL